MSKRLLTEFLGELSL